MKWISWGELQTTGNHAWTKSQGVGGTDQPTGRRHANDKPKAFCSNVLEQFVEHTTDHFGAEERLMDAYRYPKAEEHKAIHAMLIKDVLSSRRPTMLAKPTNLRLCWSS